MTLTRGMRIALIVLGVLVFLLALGILGTFAGITTSHS
jgi:hypothetical protein